MARGWRKSKKLGTKNKYQAARRDELAAAALAAAEAADRAAAAELLADLATQEDQQYASPQTVVKPKHNPLAAGQRARWRSMIIWKYVELGCPPKKQWEGRGGTVATISKWLEQSELADKRPILEVLTRYVSNEAQIKSRLGVQQKLTQGESNVAADALAAGHSKEMVGFIISEWRTKQGRTGKDAQISKKAIFTAFRNMGGVTSKRGTTSTGSRDPDSAWAKSRLAQALQWKAQLVVPERVVAEARAAVARAAVARAAVARAAVAQRAPRQRSKDDGGADAPRARIFTCAHVLVSPPPCAADGVHSKVGRPVERKFRCE
jgi:hypothetical protein